VRRQHGGDKPSEYTSATVLRLAELVIEAGFPPGAVNIVTGFGVEAGQPLVDHPALAKISFTGSTATGARIAFSGRPVHRVHPRARRQIAQHRVRGRQRQRPMGVVAGIFAAAGQTCIAAAGCSHIGRSTRAVERVTERARSIRIGDPLEEAASSARWRSRRSATRSPRMSTSAGPKGPVC
jgi:aldehyde dehydrogenase (NAD+)